MEKKIVAFTAMVSLTLISLTFIVLSANAGLVAYWPLDENTGEEIIDATGNGFDGTFNGDPEWVEGVFGMALEFDGDDHVVVPGASEINPEEITMATWVNFDEVVGYRQDFLSRGDDYAFTLGGHEEDQTIHAVITTGGDWVDFSGLTTVDPNKWYYVALTYDADTEMVTLWLDGENDGEQKAQAGMEHRLGGSLTIGTYNDRYLKGRLDEIRIWDEALSPEEIKASMEPASVKPAGKLSITWGEIKRD